MITKLQIALLLAGLLGSVLKAWATQSQETFSKKSVVDVVLGGLAAVLVPQFLPSLLPPDANLLSTFAIVAVISYASADFVQNIIGKFGVALPGGSVAIKLWPILLLPLALLAGCSTISGNPASDLRASSGLLGKTVAQGLLDATFNLDSAVKVGALDATDPAPPCFHSVLQQLGIDPAMPTQGPDTSFTPRRSDLISEGSILYIRARQLQKLQGAGIQTPPACKALIGQFLIDAAGAGLKVQPGGGLLVPLR